MSQEETKKKVVVLLNFCLVLVSSLLLLNLFGGILRSIGNALYSFDPAQNLCLIESSERLQSLDIINCCDMVRRQSICIPHIKMTAWGESHVECSIPNSLFSYHLNNKAFYFCQEEIGFPGIR